MSHTAAVMERWLFVVPALLVVPIMNGESILGCRSWLGCDTGLLRCSGADDHYTGTECFRCILIFEHLHNLKSFHLQTFYRMQSRTYTFMCPT